MPRPERPIKGNGPLARFARELRDLRRQAGTPPYRTMARTVGMSPSALAEAASAVTQPTWPLTEAYVRACNGDIAHWRRRWELLTAEHTTRREERRDSAPKAPGSRMHFRLLGPVRVIDHNGDEVALGSKERSVLALLLLSANQSVSHDHLIDQLWGNYRSFRHPTEQLYKSISAIRRALAASHAHAELSSIEQSYRLEVPAEQIDLRQFQLLVQQGRRCRNDGDTQTASRLLRQALALWTGEPLTDVTSPALDISRDSLSEQRRAAYEESLAVDLDLGRYIEVIEGTTAVTTEYPLRERLHALRMMALYRAGRRADALNVYHDIRQILVQELGIDPGPELRHIYQAILTDDPALHAPSALLPEASLHPPVVTGTRGVPPDTTLINLAFDGRDTYLQRLIDRYRWSDLEALVPSEVSGQHTMPLSSLYIPQRVRLEPPPMELPKQLWRDLIEAPDLPDDLLLPEGLTVEQLIRARATDRARPTRPALDILADHDHQRLVVLGDPGAGKSTLMYYIVLSLAGGSPEGPLQALSGWLPFLVELRHYTGSRWQDHTILDLIDHQHATEGLGLPKAVLDPYLRDDGRAVVIFDGLDEILDPKERETTTRQIAAFAAQYPQVRIVVTSRVIGYRRALLNAAGFAHVTLQDLDQDQITQFVVRWYDLAYRSDPGEVARRQQRLLATIADSPSLQQLAVNPLLLTLLTLIGQQQDLPRHRSAAYRHIVSTLVEYRDLHRHLRDTPPTLDYIDGDDKKELLRLVARHMYEGQDGLTGNHLPAKQLLDITSSYLTTRYQLPPEKAKTVAKAVLVQLRERDFLLSRIGPDSYGFLHRSFLEYFTAADLVHRLQDEHSRNVDELINEVFDRHWADPVWQEVLVLAAGMLPEQVTARAIDYLLHQANPRWTPDRQEPPQHVLLAVRCLGEIPQPSLLTEQGRDTLTELIALLTMAHEQQTITDPSSKAVIVDSVHQIALSVLDTLDPNWPARGRYQDWLVEHSSMLSSPDDDSTSVSSPAGTSPQY
jgi:DNA-binding SARP family transcriptional activator